MNKRSLTLRYLLLVIIFLFVGTSVYCFFHPDIIAFQGTPFYSVKPVISIENHVLRRLIVGSVSDFCWSVAFTLGLQSVLSLKKKRIILLLCSSILGIVVELLQLIHVIHGVFDPIDIIVYFFGSGCAIIIIGVINYEKS